MIFAAYADVQLLILHLAQVSIKKQNPIASWQIIEKFQRENFKQHFKISFSVPRECCAAISEAESIK